MSKNVAYWVASALFAGLVLAKFSPQTGFTSLIRFGETWQERRLSVLQGLPLATVPDSSGYDGQFYAQLALDPLLRGPELEMVIDAPAYRARRILVPAIAATLGLGHPWWTLQSFALINVGCWFALGWLLFRQMVPTGKLALARWIGCMFSLGVLESVRQSLVDLPALLLLVLAVNAHAQSRPGKSAAWLALGNLAKETNLLGTLALHCDSSLRPFPWRRVCLGLVVALVPLALWSFYVQQRFTHTPNPVGLGNFSWPFLGLLVQARSSLRELSLGHLDSRYGFSLIALIGFMTQSWVLWRTRLFSSPWWRLGAAHSILLLFLSSWVWSGYWAVCRAVLPMTIAFNLLLPGTRGFWPLWIAGNLTMLHAIWRFL